MLPLFSTPSIEKLFPRPVLPAKLIPEVGAPLIATTCGRTAVANVVKTVLELVISHNITIGPIALS